VYAGHGAQLTGSLEFIIRNSGRTFSCGPNHDTSFQPTHTTGRPLFFLVSCDTFLSNLLSAVERTLISTALFTCEMRQV
jgi:hypothetical protein